MLLFHLPKAGKRGLHAQFLHVGRIDRAHQRLDQPVERLPAQPAADELGHALVALVAPRRNEILQGGPKFPQRAEDRRDRHRPELRGGHHHETVRQAMQAAAADHERAAAVRIGLHKLARQPQALTQIEAPRHGGDKIVGALLDLVAIAVDGGNDAPQPRASLKKCNLALGRQFPEPMRGRQPGDSPANHGNSLSFR